MYEGDDLIITDATCPNRLKVKTKDCTLLHRMNSECTCLKTIYLYRVNNSVIIWTLIVWTLFSSRRNYCT